MNCCNLRVSQIAALDVQAGLAQRVKRARMPFRIISLQSKLPDAESVQLPCLVFSLLPMQMRMRMKLSGQSEPAWFWQRSQSQKILSASKEMIFELLFIYCQERVKPEPWNLSCLTLLSQKQLVSKSVYMISPPAPVRSGRQSRIGWQR
jgi:hypothetical protein